MTNLNSENYKSLFDLDPEPFMAKQITQNDLIHELIFQSIVNEKASVNAWFLRELRPFRWLKKLLTNFSIRLGISLILTLVPNLNK